MFICILILLITGSSFAGINVLSELTYEKTVKPGSSFEGFVTIQNTGDDVQEVKLYLKDYLFYSNGQNLYDEPGTTERSNADWIQLDQSVILVDGQSQVNVPYTVNIPASEDMDGTYWSILMIEGAPEVTPETMQQSSVGINTVMRYGIQIVTHFGESGDRSLKFLNAELVTESEKNIFKVDIENDGERWLRPAVWVELFNQDGISMGKYSAISRRTYPGTSIKQMVDLTEVPEGTYKALVVADCGDDDLFGIQYNLTIAGTM